MKPHSVRGANVAIVTDLEGHIGHDGRRCELVSERTALALVILIFSYGASRFADVIDAARVFPPTADMHDRASYARSGGATRALCA